MQNRVDEKTVEEVAWDGDSYMEEPEDWGLGNVKSDDVHDVYRLA